MRRYVGLLIGVCTLMSLAPLAGVAQEPAAGGPVQIVKVYPNKVRYLRGEKGTVQVILRNTSQTDQTVTLEGETAQELALVTPLLRREVTAPANKEITLDLPFTAPTHEYGCAVRVRVKQGDKVIAEARDMFGVADNLWNVAIGAELNMMSASGYGWIDPRQDLKTARDNYFNWWEKAFWAPDDFGDLLPKEERWHSGQSGRLEIRKVIKEFIGLAKANGIASLTYGKSTAAGPAGWELARRHPDWFVQDGIGRIVGTFDTAYMPAAGGIACWGTRSEPTSGSISTRISIAWIRWIGA